MTHRTPQKGEALYAESLAGETQEGFKTSDLERRRQRYGSAKADAMRFRRFLLNEGESKLADELGDCGNYLAFREYFTIGQTRLAKICTCKRHLVCPLCAIRRAAKSVRVNLAKVEELLKADPLLKAYLVTLTVKNGPSLAERFQHLTAGVRAYHRRRSRARQHGEVLKASAAVWSYEFTNIGNGWHPHVHAVWLCHEAPDALRLSREWQEITGDSFMVDVTPMDEGDPAGAFCEVFKYALKFADMRDPDRLHAFKVLRGKRLQGSFGALRGLDVEPADSDELLDDLPYIERLFVYVDGRGYIEDGTTGEIHNMTKEAA